MTEDVEEYLRNNMRLGLRVSIQPLYQAFVNPARTDFVYLATLSDWKDGFATWCDSADSPLGAVEAVFAKMRADKKPRFKSAKKVGRRAS